MAQAELDWITVTSPIDGVAGVPVGDLVTAGQAEALATVTRLDPIEVDMYEPSARMLSVISDITEGRLQMNEKLRATLTLETGQTWEATGELLAPGFSVSTSTGAADTRFRFDNPRNLVLPGVFVRGQVELGTVRTFLVSQSATTRDRTGKLTAWVVEDGKAMRSELINDGTRQHHWIVTNGLEESDLLEVDGLTDLSEGAEVATVAASLSTKTAWCARSGPRKGMMPQRTPTTQRRRSKPYGTFLHSPLHSPPGFRMGHRLRDHAGRLALLVHPADRAISPDRSDHGAGQRRL